MSTAMHRHMSHMAYRIPPNYSRLRLIRPHQNTIFVRINRSDELRVPFNITEVNGVCLNSSEPICPN